ncbi:MAG: CBS domain-containing protein [Treponema sp.]|nr:CBS domain-containing protein [Treponema sp.]
MIRDPVCTHGNTPVIRCIEKMRLEQVDSVLITDQKGHLLGILTARRAQREENKSLPVEKVMRTGPATCPPDQNIVDILRVVNEEGLSSIPVVNEDNELEGLITKSSLLTTLSQQYLDLKEE